MPCDDASPQHSPQAQTSSLSSPPPVRKSSTVRCLHELQNQASPTKPRKLARTESGIQMPAIILSESALIMPVDLNSCLTEPLPFDKVIQDLDAVLDEHYDSGDPKGKRPMPTDPRRKEHMQPTDAKDPVANDTEDESLDGEPRDKTTMDIDANDAKPPPSAAKCTLLSTMRKKGVTGSSSAYNSASITDILDTPSTSKKMPFDARVTPDAKSNFDVDFGLAFGLYENDD
jgi:hypothetical protein